MRTKSWAIVAIVTAWLAAAAQAQIKEEQPFTGQPGKVETQRWRIGMTMTAEGGSFKRVLGTTSVPMDWPEQKVRIVEQDVSDGVTVSYQVVDGAAKQMVVKTAALGAGEEAKAIVTFEIKRFLPDPPENTADYNVPHPKRLDRKTAACLTPSPYIESQNAEIKHAAQEAMAGKEKAWEKVEAIYDWVRAKIKFKDNRGGEPKSAFEAMHEGVGDCDEMTSLFVAMCRSAEIPARTVRVAGHVYPEFYLLDVDGKGHWFPCQASGTRAFGGMFDPRPILQKGDNIQVVDPNSKKKTKCRFLPENLIGYPASGGGTLKPKLICEQVKE